MGSAGTQTSPRSPLVSPVSPAHHNLSQDEARLCWSHHTPGRGRAVPRAFTGQGCSHQEPSQKKKTQPQKPQNSSKCTSFSAVQTQQEKPSPSGGGRTKAESVTPPPQRPGRAVRALSPWINCASATSRVPARKLPQKEAVGLKEMWQAVTGAEVKEPKRAQQSSWWLQGLAKVAQESDGDTASARRDHPHLGASLCPGWPSRA